MSHLATIAPSLFGAGREPQYATTPTPVPSRRPQIQSGQPGRPVPRGLSMRPIIVVNGETITLAPIGDLVKAIGRSVGHVRLLEDRGVIPPAPRRRQVRGHAGWRLYDQRYIAAIALIARAERVSSRTRVTDLSRFKARVWAAHEELRSATARP